MILSPRSKERLIENNPLYKYVDYWEKEEFVGPLNTITVEEYNVHIQSRVSKTI